MKSLRLRPTPARPKQGAQGQGGSARGQAANRPPDRASSDRMRSTCPSPEIPPDSPP